MPRLYSLLLLMSSAVFLFSTPAGAEEAQAGVKSTALRGPLHLLQGKGGNVVASVGIDGILLVDDDYADLAPAYAQAIAGLAQSDIAPSFVLNTHWHEDHTGSNEFWALLGAVIYAHTNVRLRMSTRQEVVALGKVVEPSPAMALPVVTYGDSLALHVNGEDVEVQHYPRGHTDGDSVVYFSNENVVHVGDLLFKDAFPFVDLGSGGSVSGYVANIEAVLARIDDETLVVPGHGSLANKGDLQRVLQMIRATSAAVESALARGLSVEAISEQGLGEEWDAWGKGFVDEPFWIRTIADSLQASSASVR